VSRLPRLLPLVGIAIGGVLAVKAVGAAPQIWGATQALAEDVARPKAPPVAPNASLLSGTSAANASAAPKAPPAACAPTASELAREAGLSPAELQVLQSLSDRRGQLDQRETSLDTQVQLIAAAEAKLDSRIQQMNQLKSDIQGLLGQADQQAQSEQDRLVRIYEDMDPKKAAAAMAILADDVRLPIAAKMKERKLAEILKYMTPQDAKALTEKLAQRTASSRALADARAALNGQNQPITPAANAAAPSTPPAAASAAAPSTPAATADATAAKDKKAPPKRKVAKATKTPKARPKVSPADAGQAAAAAPKTPPAPTSG